METRGQAVQRQLALANGPVHPTDERNEPVEATMAEMDERIGQTHTAGVGSVQELAQQTVAAVANLQQQLPPVQVPSASSRQHQDVEMAAATRQLRKMETKPPTFEGDIDGVKLNIFIFQFESYFTFKGYDLAVDDTVVGLELGQCARKNATTWYETFHGNEDLECHEGIHGEKLLGA
ncbi:unnamed protein product [Phytophthora fragariaefolia]|uniref:Unnamed protein product n=1 Tax=Phytophthora fragariaefolia TaxID=1490495 RepID=A0A9W6YPB4_9STRA|nr:unnamed protein product [Phytophthora fragariaefolia]